jgi:hypothetical protein
MCQCIKELTKAGECRPNCSSSYATMENRKMSAHLNRLLEIGVPRELHNLRVGSLGYGQSVVRWLSNEGGLSLERGESWYVVTSSNEHHKLLPIIIGQYAGRGGSAAYARLGTLVEVLDTRDYKKFDEISKTRLLGIGDFFQAAAGPRERPFTTLQRSRIEELLLFRKDRQLPTMLQIHNPSHLLINSMSWWTNTVMERMEMKTFTVGDPPVENSRRNSALA